jgi:hypothetical protein
MASVKALFSQQAKLLSLNGNQAIVVVRPNLIKLAETKITPIQEAMSQVLGYPVMIKLQPQSAANSSSPVQTTQNIPASSSVSYQTPALPTTPSLTTPSPTTPLQPASHNTVTHASHTVPHTPQTLQPSSHTTAPQVISQPTALQPTAHQVNTPQIPSSTVSQAVPYTHTSQTLQPTQTISPQTISPQAVTPPVISQSTPLQSTPLQSTPLKTTSLQTTAPTMNQIWNEDEALRAAKNVAQFFNGEIVLDTDALPEENTVDTPLEEDVIF